jgi:pimeloyl-ACP methyl ester carboxylesterase
MTRPFALAGKAFSLLLALFFLCPIASGHSQTGPLELSGELHGAPYRIIVPENWNGTLLVYAHGYRDKADHPGEVDDRSVSFEGLEPALLSFGYAVAASAYRDNGWVVEDGIQDTKDLTVLFRSQVAVPDRTILLGVSMGTVIAFKSMERFGGIYDGAICACAIGAGASRFQDSAVAGALAYDVLFGIPASWGTVGEVRNDIDFDTEVVPKLFTEVSNPLNFGKFEFIRLVTGIPGQGIFLPPPPTFYPYWVFTHFFNFESRGELQRRAGGPFVQNLNHTYSLTEAEKAYLAGFGVDADALLSQMNARRNIAAPPAPRNYVERSADYSGKIKHPVLTMHTIVDEVVPVSNESAYADTIAAAGKQNLLFQTYTNGVGHCNFAGEQIFSSVFAMDSWVSTGVRPTAASFPAAFGFVPGFGPPPFPQP